MESVRGKNSIAGALEKRHPCSFLEMKACSKHAPSCFVALRIGLSSHFGKPTDLMNLRIVQQVMQLTLRVYFLMRKSFDGGGGKKSPLVYDRRIRYFAALSMTRGKLLLFDDFRVLKREGAATKKKELQSKELEGGLILPQHGKTELFLF
jgi:hypothetical protein